MIEFRLDPSYGDLLQIMSNLRPLDRIEAGAMSFHDTPEGWAGAIVAAGGLQWGVYLDNQPVVTIGAVPRWQNVWSAWCLGTADFPKVALSVSRHAKKVMLPAVIRLGMVRADAFVLDDYDAAHKWLRVIGALPEATLANWGKNGETFVSYVWLREAALKTLERTASA